MRLRPFLPKSLWQQLRSRYWASFWAKYLERQKVELGEHAAQSLVGSERATLAEAIGDCYPFKSLLEIGCAYAQNFHVIAPQYPSVRFVGVDADEERVQAGAQVLKQHQIYNAVLVSGYAEDLHSFDDKSFDLVISAACLLYVGKERIEKAAREMLRVSKKKILLLEQQTKNGDFLGEYVSPQGVEIGYWLRDYAALFQANAPRATIQVERVQNPLWKTEQWQQLGHLISITLH